ncbi:hypothetical protein IFM89_015352, partial [Coptis chinensis]
SNPSIILNDYIVANNLTGLAGNGPFREVLISLDGKVTPFLGRILDGMEHKFGFGVTNALDVWYIDANLHIIGHGLDGTFLTKASRSIYSSGWVESSHGKVVTHSFQEFSFTNFMRMGKNGSLQIVSQTINSNYSIDSKLSSHIYKARLFQNLPFYLYNENVDQGNGSYTSIVNISLGYNEESFLGQSLFGFLASSLKNVQNGQGSTVVKGNLVTSGLGSTQQVYNYDGTGGCFFRNLGDFGLAKLCDHGGDPQTSRHGRAYGGHPAISKSWKDALGPNSTFKLHKFH